MESGNSGMLAIYTELGYVAFARFKGVVVGVTIGHADPMQAVRALSEAGVDTDEELAVSDPLARKLVAFAAGEQMPNKRVQWTTAGTLRAELIRRSLFVVVHVP